MQFVVNHGHKIAYYQYGDKASPAALLIMGMELPGLCWPPILVQKLIEEGFQVIIPDNRDAGQSMHLTDEHVDQGDVVNGILNAIIGRQVSQAKYRLEDMAVDMVHLLDELQITRAHVVGFSMGGMIAQVIASNYPERVSTLVSISSATGHVRTGLGKLMTIWSLIREPKAQEPFENYVRSVVTGLAGPAYQPAQEEIQYMYQQMEQQRFDREALYRQLLGILASGDRSPSLAKITAPALVIHGKNDPLLPFAAGEETAALIPEAELWAIDGLGHQLPMKLMSQYGQRIALHCHKRM